MEPIVGDPSVTNRYSCDNQVHQAQQLLELVRRYRTSVEQESAEKAIDRQRTDTIALRQVTTQSVLEQIVAQLSDAKADWQRHWEQSAIRLATAIAQRIVRSELSRRPEIALEVVTEALQLAAGATDITLHVSPADHELLESQLQRLAATLCQLAPTAVVADSEISPGGCRVDTKFGQVDLQIESQLRRIEQELLYD
jgi:flagellar biosynthesis/type III secretory pathway protein FliH